MKNTVLNRWVGLAMLMMVLTSVASAQRKLPTAEDILSVNGAQGKEFYIAIPPNEIGAYPVEGLEVYVASAFDTEVTVTDFSGNRTYKRKVKAGEIRTLSDKRGETNWTWELKDNSEMVEKKAIRLTAPQPISVYVINSKTFTSDGFLAIPTSAWGKEYISTSYYDFREFDNWAGGFVIIAKNDGTEVTINLRGVGEMDATTAGGRRINTGQPFTINMEQGDVYLVKGNGQTRGSFDLTGSQIVSNQPIGLISFHERTTMPNLLINGNGRNHLVEMTPPVSTWGKKYITLEYNRGASTTGGKGDVFRVVASQPNTKWTLKYYDKSTYQVLGQGGGVLNKAGEFADIIQSQAPAAITQGFSVWTADKPVFVMQYSCSSTWDGDPILDPYMINVVPEEQFIPNTIFQTPTLSQFVKHRLNLIVWADPTDPNYIDNLKSLEIDSIPVWSHPQAVAPRLLFTNMPGTNYHWCSIDFGTVATSHRIKGNGKVKFGGYIYGYGAVDAYGWPAASGFRPTATIDTMPPLIVADSNCGDYNFEATELRNIPDPPLAEPKDSDQVETGIAFIDTVAGSNSYNYRLIMITADDLPREPSFKRFRYRWEVIDKSKDAWAEYFVQDWADNVTFDTVFYFADKLLFSPNPLKFGKLRLGDKKRMDITITNQSDGDVKLTESSMKVGSYFSIVTGALPPEVTLKKGQTHTFTIEYDGSRETQNVETDFDKDTLIVKTECGEFKVGMDGVAAIPCITVADFDAGTLALNEVGCAVPGLRITNPGSDTLIITAITGYNGTNFTVSNPTDPALPIRIAPKQFIDLKNICYSRADVGSDEINVTFSNNGSGGANCTADSISKWTGMTQSPGPFITGKNWLQRRVNTLHEGRGKVGNSGTQTLRLKDVTFADGTKYYPAGATEANYVFKIGRMLQGGNPVTDINLANNQEVDVEVYFRPAAVQVYNAVIQPVWDDFNGTNPTARLQGEGIIPAFESDGAAMTCSETPENQGASRDLVITNNGSMDLTITSIAPTAALPAGWAFTDPSPITISFVPGNNVRRIPVTYTRPAGYNGASNVTFNITHDAVPGDGTDSVAFTPKVDQESFSVGSCSGPDIVVTNIDYGRQLANCDQPLLEFTITNTGGGLIPLEIRDIIPTGADAPAFTVVNIIGANGQPAATPFTIPAQQSARVQVRFTPTEPNAAPWTDRPYSAQFRIMNYVEGNPDELKPDTYVELDGIGFVIPITMNLTNSTNGNTVNPGVDDPLITFTVDATSTGSWPRAALTQFTATVTYETRALAFSQNSIQTTNLTNGWTIGNPVETKVDDTYSTWTFTANGPTPITGNGDLFTFKATLLLGPNFDTKQELAVDLLKQCLVPSTTGTGTEIVNCALTKRVVSVGSTQFSFRPVAPNPVVNSTAKIDFGIGIKAPATIEVVNMEGQVVSRLVDQVLDSGEYTLEFPTTNLGNGVYMLRITCSDYTETQRVVIAK